jgi:hypothetical protein
MIAPSPYPETIPLLPERILGPTTSGQNLPEVITQGHPDYIPGDTPDISVDLSLATGGRIRHDEADGPG